ncbi:MAG: DUF7123 family protein [Halobacteriota archaeon]
MTEEYNEDQRRILSHLRASVSRGKTYFKSKSIADATGLSSKQVGVHLSNLKDACEDLEIEKWGYSTSTTWQVSESA